MKKLLLFLFFLCSVAYSYGQVSVSDSSIVDYNNPKEYLIGGISVSGAQYLDKDILITLSGLRVKDRVMIPGQDISKALQNLWKQGLFAGAEIRVARITGDTVYLDFHVQERPRLSSFTFKGVRKGEQDDLRDKINLMKGKVLTDNILVNTKNIITNFYKDKGHLKASVDIKTVKDTAAANSVIMIINIDKGPRVKIDNIVFTGNENVKPGKLHRLMKKTKENPWYSVFTVSKFLKSDYTADKDKVIAYYNTKGYRDARIVTDTVYQNANGNLDIAIQLSEGNKYYFRNITFSGNSKYRTGRLDTILAIQKGDVYNEELLQRRLLADPNGNDVSSLYMDDGYLFFSATPVEVAIVNDSIDLEIRIYEGPQATINAINITGNTKTSEHVIRRVIRTLPGNKFSRADVIRTQREIAAMGFFDPEKIGITPEPHPENGTVDINYSVEEKPSDQLELSAGYGGSGQGIVGALGVSFNNFSLRNMFAKGGWSPIPSGDGQRLSVRVTSNGRQYQSYSASFTEPWLGGKKPNSLSLSFVHTRYTNGYYYKKDNPLFGSLVTNGGAIGFGKQLKWPDDFFTLISSLEFQQYTLKNYQLSYFNNEKDGSFNNLGLSEVISRNSVGDNPQYPTHGSNFTLSVKLTPPYSLLSNKDYSTMSFADKFKWIEYHKYRFTAEWYTNLVGKFVVKTSAKMGFVGYYNKDIGVSGFERFVLTKDVAGTYNPILGQENIIMRGYDRLSPEAGSIIFNKFTAELRYPFSTNPSTFIYGLVFAEAGNVWDSFKDYNPYKLNRSAGVGLRVYLPAFGLLGFDYGIPFDDPLLKGEKFGKYLGGGKLSIILGFEPD